MKTQKLTRYIPWLWLLLLSLLTAGCIPGPGGDPCEAADLIAPVLISPADFASAGEVAPELSWSFSGDCDPDHFDIQMAKDRDFTVEVTNTTVAGSNTEWTPTAPLDFATEYWWRVAAVADIGGDSISGTYSQRWRFYFGPTCDPAHMTNPGLVWPADGETVDTVMPRLEWNYLYGPGCLPEGYRIELSPTPDFSDTTWNGGTGNPSTKWLPGDDLIDCATYYWRVTPMVGTASGPVSETRSFHVHVSCSAIMPGASIAGTVWHDECAVPYASGSPAPEGCVDLPGGAMGADGIFEPGEPGLEGVTVHLGAGDCPAVSVASAITDEDGQYIFPDLRMGHYCVSVNALEDGNDLILIPGDWTFPESDSEPISSAVMLIPAEALTDVNFGWDYQFLPPPEGPTPTPTPAEPTAKAIQNAHCRYGPDREIWDDKAFLMEGESTRIEGRLADNEWVYVVNPQGSGFCWIYVPVLEIKVALEDFPIIQPPALPTGSIAGLVWHDLCAPPQQYTTPPPPPPGCVDLGGYCLAANGVLEGGEPGIGGVIVRLSTGSCPGVSLSSTTTAGDGSFSFGNLLVGDYCVSLVIDDNINVLIPGGFTYPAYGGTSSSQTVSVSAGNTSSGIYFGWDYQFLP